MRKGKNLENGMLELMEVKKDDDVNDLKLGGPLDLL